MAAEEKIQASAVDGTADGLRWRPEGTGKAAKILVVDDDEVVLGVVGLQLEAHGFTVATCSSTQHAFEALFEAIGQGRPFNLLITDFDMPGNRGNVLIRAVRDVEEDGFGAQRDRLPILLLTSVALSSLSELEQDDLMTPGVSYLSKENAVDRLVPTVKSILRHELPRLTSS